jgi:50S ribosomal protein L16 3-hydroxylase
MSLQRLISLARNDACEARIVITDGGQHEVLHGPFSRGLFRELPEKHWTLLVQGVNHVCPAARALLNRFSFLPFARLDDIMVSYAAPGGGVGPHFDSYDVFLLQGPGQRLWEVSAQDELELIPGLDLRILRHFRPDGHCIVDPGDMLYLPPRFAHNGTALNACITYSIGFRAASYEELKSRFLGYIDDNTHIEGRYADPELTPTAHPAQISTSMVERVADKLSQISWSRSDIADFLGRYLSEPKPYIVLSTPKSLTHQEFCRQAYSSGIELHPALPLLFHGQRAFINGEALDMKPGARQAIILLANQRRLDPAQLRGARGASRVFHSWYGNGYLSVGNWGMK